MAAEKARVYLAAPLFTQAERRWNIELAAALVASGFHMIVPQVIAGDFIFERGGYVPDRDAEALFRLSAGSVVRSDCVLAVLDGADPDSGTCFECAIAWRERIPVVGVRTDFRTGGDGKKNVNLMLSESCLEVVLVNSLEHAEVSAVAERVVPAIRRALETAR